MVTGHALLTGAGTSADRPAGLPLGREFDALLRVCCFEAASQLAPDVIDADGLKVVEGLRPNLLTRLAVCAGVAPVAALLQCFRVNVPTEAHMVAAAHAMEHALHVTLNFDDGVERAYALITGRAELGPSVPHEYHSALEDWKRLVRPSAPLRVVASQFDAVDFAHRPLLVKLRGSAAEGWHPSVIAAGSMPSLDVDRLSDDQVIALRAAAATGILVVAGVSGSDTDCLHALIPLLVRGRFTWTAAELDPEVVAVLAAIDAAQPVLRPALEGLRSAFAGAADLPAWPRTPTGADGFADDFATWRSRLAPDGPAEVYASLLSDVALHEQATALRRVLQTRRRGGKRATVGSALVETSVDDVASHGIGCELSHRPSITDERANPRS